MARTTNPRAESPSKQQHVILLAAFLILASCAPSTLAIRSSPSSFSVRIPGKRYASEWDNDVEKSGGWLRLGWGRECSLFNSRGGGSFFDDEKNGNNDSGKTINNDHPNAAFDSTFNEHHPYSTEFEFPPRFHSDSDTDYKDNTSNSSPPSSPARYRNTIHSWWKTTMVPSLDKLPRVVCRVEPTTTLKLRKTFRPLKTIVRLGADFNTQLGVWKFHSSWEDAIIGGRLTLAGKELQFTKSWLLPLGAVENMATRLRFRAAIHLETLQTHARVGFRTERFSPMINVMDGFTIMKQLPLDGTCGNIKLEVKANVALPEPEIQFTSKSTDGTQDAFNGKMGDVHVSIEELNLLLDY